MARSRSRRKPPKRRVNSAKPLPAEPGQPLNARALAGLIVAIVLSVVVYLRLPAADFVWDDVILVERQLPSIRTVKDAFFPPQGLREWGDAYYRPVVILTFMAERALAGPAMDFETQKLRREPSQLGHWSNIVFHSICVALLWVLAWRLMAGSNTRGVAAGICATLFAVHPMASEAMGFVSGRTDLLATLFTLAFLHTALCWWHARGAARRGWFGVSLAAFALALLCKEVAVAAVGLALAIGAIVPGVVTSNRDAAMRRAALLVGGCVAVFIGYALLRHSAGAAAASRDFGSMFQLESVGKAIMAVGFYFKSAVVPWPQNHFILKFPAAWEIWVGLTVATGWLGLALSFWQRGKSRIPMLGLVWFCMALAPSLIVAVVTISDSPLAERYLYLPLAGFALAVGCMMAGMQRVWLRYGLCAALIAGFGLITWQRTAVWMSDVALWRDGVRKSPDAGLPWTNLGFALMTAYSPGSPDYPARMNEALEAFDRSLDPKTDYDDGGRALASNNRGSVLANLGREEEALLAFRRALELNPGYETPHYNIANVMFDRQRRMASSVPGLIRPDQMDRKALSEALELVDQAVRINPGYWKAMCLRAEILLALGLMDIYAKNPPSAAAAFGAAEQTWKEVARLVPELRHQGRKPEEWIAEIGRIRQAAEQPASKE